MLRSAKSIAAVMHTAISGQARPQFYCGVLGSSLTRSGWGNPATGSCIGGSV